MMLLVPLKIELDIVLIYRGSIGYVTLKIVRATQRITRKIGFGIEVHEIYCDGVEQRRRDDIACKRCAVSIRNRERIKDLLQHRFTVQIVGVGLREIARALQIS